MPSIEIDGAVIAYEDSGTARSGGATLLLIHGFPLSREMWRAQIEPLSRTARVIVPDLRGFGASTLGPWPGREPSDASPSLDRYADDLVQLIEHSTLTGPLVLCGFSMGGYVAMAMARRRVACFDALALLDTRATADNDKARETRLKMADKIHEWGAGRVAEMMRPNLFAAGTPESVVRSTTAMIAATDPLAIAAAQCAMATRPDSTDLLPRIDKPTLVVVGTYDVISSPAEMREMAAAMPHSSFVEIANAGHMTPVENPTAVTEALAAFAGTIANETRPLRSK